MTETVSNSTIMLLVLAALITVIGPIIVMILWRIKKKVNLMPALVGALIFLIFAKCLESIPHVFCIILENPVSRFITGNGWVYALYAGLMAGIFEETGRFIAFRFFLKKHKKKETAITYGIGHGGFECIIVVGFAYIAYLSYAIMINSGTMDTMLSTLSGNALTSMQSVVSSINTLNPVTIFWGILERCTAIIFHIALSIMVFYAVGKKKISLFFIAILLHAGIDVIAALGQIGVITNIAILEVIILGYALVVTYFAYKMYRNNGVFDSAQ